MTVTTMETNLDEVQEAEMAILSVDKDGKQNMRLYQIRNAEFRIVKLVSLNIALINLLTFSGIFLLALVQLLGWKESFKNNRDSDIQAQFKQMTSSYLRYSTFFLVIMLIKLISMIEPDGFVATCRKVYSVFDRNHLIIIMCFSFILVFFVCPSKAAERMAQNIIKVEYTLSTVPIALSYLKFLVILSSAQHIYIITVIVRMKSKYFRIGYVEDRYLSNAITEQEEEKEEEINTISETYVIC